MAAFAVTTNLAADIPKAPVPPSPYLPVIYRFADAMVEKGRDTYGRHKTGVFLSALDRATLQPLTNRPPAPEGVREDDRSGTLKGPLTGANPQHHENFLRLLYTLSELSGKPKYREAADAELRWFLNDTAAPATGLLPWGEHMSWDVMRDEPVAANGSTEGTHEFARPWMLWPRCFEAGFEGSRRFAVALWRHQIANHETGGFDRHAAFLKHAARDHMDFPRHAGFYIRTWAESFARTGDPVLLKAMDVMLARFEKKRHPSTGLIEAHTGNANSWPGSTLSLAIDCDAAARIVPEPLAARFAAFAEREDQIFCNAPHRLKEDGGFARNLDVKSGKSDGAHTSVWNARYGASTTAQVAMMCVSRYENTGNVAYRDLIHGAADAYLHSMPTQDADVWPMTLGHAISLQVAAWRSTAQQRYLDRARELADFALKHIFDQGPLPRASLKSNHYEAITGADTLALGLVELHLHILGITAVRCPPNTIDR